MEAKIIKEEITEKEITTNFSSTENQNTALRSRLKGSKDRCKTPDSPEGARLGPQTNTSSSTSSTTVTVVVPQNLSPNSSNNHSSPPLARNGNTSPVTHNNSNSPSTPPLSLTLDSNHIPSQSYPIYGSTSSLRHLHKVKRFLGTLVQFGSDIGPEIGDKVRSLVLNLVSSNLGIEEFHQSLQEVTNFPLRPFVLPFLRTHLPILQREIHNLARASKQSTLQYVRSHDHIVLDPTFSPSEASEIFLPTEPPSMVHKRRASDSFYENGVINGGIQQTNATMHETNEYGSPPNKRQITSTGAAAAAITNAHHQNAFLLSTAAQHNFFLSNPVTNLHNLTANNHFFNESYPHTNYYNQHLQSSRTGESLVVENNETPTAATVAPSISHIPNPAASRTFPTSAATNYNNQSSNNRADEEWKNIYVMLNCILSMVEKTKRALSILQQRGCQQDQQTNDWLRKQDIGVDLKKAANEIITQAIRQTEDRVAEVKRKAEEAVNEVKKQAVIELQKAVSIAENKACELVANERAKMEKMLLEVRLKQSASEDGASFTNHHSEENSQSPPVVSSQLSAPSQQNSCWNCGRKANETCSGCNLARYCGAFCQHKDWENHHSVCAASNSNTVKLLSSAISKQQSNSSAINNNKQSSAVSVTSSIVPINNNNAVTTNTRENNNKNNNSNPVTRSTNSRSATPVTSTNGVLNQGSSSVVHGNSRSRDGRETASLTK